MVSYLIARDAVERVKRFKAECDVRTRKQEIYHAGEELFGFPHQIYPELEQTKKELANLTLLYDIYVQVSGTETASSTATLIIWLTRR